jgi:aryl-alcohol dehydrogenase-like predicted oxidoreductase
VQHKILGKTGLQISTLSLGTVSLGMDYGIHFPGDFGRPRESESIKLLQFAAESGITLFDTAPNYGTSEALLGKALGKRTNCLFATKVSIPKDGKGAVLGGNVLKSFVFNSLDASRRALKRDVLDVVQIHNATTALIKNREMTDTLILAREKGIIRYLGASVYTIDEALAVIEDGRFSFLQVAYNLFDQRMTNGVFACAETHGVGVVTRSALLKGALTVKSKVLPKRMEVLKIAADKAMRYLAGSWDLLPEMAIRFCLSNTYITSILVGPRSIPELEVALHAASKGALSEQQLEMAESLGLLDAFLLNPSNWPVE